MNELMNTLFVLTQGAMLRLDHDAVVVERPDDEPTRLPLLRLEAIAVFGRVSLSSSLIHRCADDGRAITWHDYAGRFKGRLEGSVRGNVLLRRDQHLTLSEPAGPARIARQIVAGKIQNSRQVLLRAARDSRRESDRQELSHAAERLVQALERLRFLSDLDEIRGAEGEAAHAYFAAIPKAVTASRTALAPHGRTKRPPRDPMNALLSFLYTLLRSECAAALEGVGLDPQVGYLHSLRPGRPALALDLMEELRPVVADRLALTLVNRRQLTPDHFEKFPGGATMLSEEGRRVVLDGYQRRKARPVIHRALERKIPIALLPHIQARLLARHLRGDLSHYPPFLYR